MEREEPKGPGAADGERARPVDRLDLVDLDGAPAEPEKAPWVLVAQFFIVPLVVVVLAVAIFLLFGVATREKLSPTEYLQEVRTGSMNRRWQAAFELAKELARRPELGADQKLFADTLATFDSMRGEREVRRYLALALGRFARPEAVPALVTALEDEDEETRLYAILALGAIGEGAALAPLVAELQAPEPALRKAAALALGSLGAREAVPALRVTAEDRRFDVRLQGALALAQLGDPTGLETLRRALDAAAYADLEMRPEQLAEATVSAIRGLVLLGDSASHERLAVIARDHPSLAVRDAALKARDELGR